MASLLLIEALFVSSFLPHSVSRGPMAVECAIMFAILIQAQKVHPFHVPNYRGFVHIYINLTDLTIEQSSEVKCPILLHFELVLNHHMSFHTNHPQLRLAYFTLEFSFGCTGKLAPQTMSLQTVGL